MKKTIKAIKSILSTAWYAALTFFCFAVFETVLFQFMDKFLNNDIVAGIVLAILLIMATICVGNYVKEKANKD